MPHEKNQEHQADIAPLHDVPSRDNAMPKNGRPVVLDDERKQLICSLVAAGYSRRRAALQVGCSPSTVTRHVKSDPQFADRLRTSKMHSELAPLGHLRHAAERSWRAAAWLLERQHPQEYGRRNPDHITRDEFRETMKELAGLLGEEIHDSEDRERVGQRINHLIGVKAPLREPEREE